MIFPRGNGDLPARIIATNLNSSSSSSPFLDFIDGGMPPPQTADLPTADMPFAGDFKGCSWNGQALFARKNARQIPKMRKAARLAAKHDFCLIQETHSLPGRAAALRLPPQVTAFWSNGSSSQAGVGILVNHKFLQRFASVRPERDFIEVIPGRIALLRLRGAEGNLDIVCMYADTHSSRERRAAMDALATVLKPQHLALTILAGDFNYVCDAKDRWNKDQGDWTGDGDMGDEKHFNERLGQPFQLYEWHQPEPTYNSAAARSRLDRVYTNQHLAHQLDRHYGAAALQWVPTLSTHRPLSFARSTPGGRQSSPAPIPAWVAKEDDFAFRVRLEYQQKLIEYQYNALALDHLLILKASIKQVSLSIMQDKSRESRPGGPPRSHSGLHPSCRRSQCQESGEVLP